jgi:hypothetical protein
VIDASETSGEESEYQEVSGAQAGTHGRRSQWGEHRDPVKQLRQQERKALEAQNDTSLGAILGADPHAVARMKAQQPIAQWLGIYLGDRTAQGSARVVELPEATAVLGSPKLLQRKTILGQHPIPDLKFSSKHNAKLARKRIIEEHKELEWPPFAVIDAPTKFVLLSQKELASSAPMPGSAKSPRDPRCLAGYRQRPLLCPRCSWRSAEGADHRHRMRVLVFPDRDGMGAWPGRLALRGPTPPCGQPHCGPLTR